MTQKNILLVGKPNAGKSTLFNQITGQFTPTGNRSGVTVDSKNSRIPDLEGWQITDLPGIDFFDTDQSSHPLDQQVTLSRLCNLSVQDLIVNVVDGTKLQTQLYLTTQLIELAHPLVIVLTHGNRGQKKLLQKQLGVKVFLNEELTTSSLLKKHLCEVKKSQKTNLIQELEKNISSHSCPITALATARFAFIQSIVGQKMAKSEQSFSQYLDKLTLNRYLGLPLFFFIMFLTFWATVVLGSLFSPLIECSVSFLLHFTLSGFSGTIFEAPLASFCFAIATISSFIAPLGFLYFMLGLLEESGYMQRAACVIDRLMQKLNLPGQSFIPIMVGFGCNVPAIMSSRTINYEHDRIQTILMSPFMSCSARLAIFSLFASSFFGTQSSGHSIIFLLYLLGFIVAIATGFVIRYVLGNSPPSCLAQEVAPYQIPCLITIMESSFRKVRRFITKAGVIIIPSTLLIHFILWQMPHVFEQPWTQSMAALFSPMGLGVEQAPAIISLIAGILAKEVVIGVLEAFHYQSIWLSINAQSAWINLIETWSETLEQIKELSFYSPFLLDIELSTQTYLHEIFTSKHAAISYMIFVLLYFPCLSVSATIAKESHRIWAIFSSCWSTLIAYSCAVLYYQLFADNFSLVTYLSYIMLFASLMGLSIYWLKRQASFIVQQSIPLRIKPA